MPAPSSWEQFALGTVGLQNGDDNLLSADQIGNIWFPTESDGVGKFNIATDTVTYITTTEGLVDNNVRHVVVDNSGCIWIAKRYTAATFNPADICLQKYDPVAETFVDYSVVDVFSNQGGLKLQWLGVHTLKKNPFSGEIFAGEFRADGSGYLAAFNGTIWNRYPDLSMGLFAQSTMQHFEFETVDRWWVVGSSFTRLVLYDRDTNSTIYTLDQADFGGGPVNNIALLSTGRLIVLDGATSHFWRVDAGIAVDSGNVGVSSQGFHVDNTDLVWSYAPEGNNTGVASYNDSLDISISYNSATIGGTQTSAGGLDALGNIVFVRFPELSAILTFGVLTGPPTFNTLEVRTVTETTVDFKAILNQVGDAYVVIVPDGAGAPTSTQVKEGKNSSGIPVAAGFADSVLLDMNVENLAASFICINLSQNTPYDAYIVAEGFGGLQATPTKLDFTTAQSSSPDTIDPGLSETITTGGQTQGLINV